MQPNSRPARRAAHPLALALLCAAAALPAAFFGDARAENPSAASSTTSAANTSAARAASHAPAASSATANPSANSVQAARVADVGCQGRVLPASRVRRVAAPADQGVPIVEKLLVDEGAEVKEGDVLAVLAAEAPARQLEEQATEKTRAAFIALAAAEADATLTLKDIELRRVDARASRAAAAAALAAVRAGAARKQLPDGAVRELEAAAAAAESALKQLRDGKAAFTARLDAAVNTAAAQRKEAGTWGSDSRITEAALAEARAAREAAAREYVAREAAAAAEVTLAKTRLDAARARNALPERDAAEVAAAVEALAAEDARPAALDALHAATRAVLTQRINGAHTELAAAQAALALAKERLAQTSVRAPVSGRVLRVFARAGEAPGAGGAIAEIANLSKMSVEAEVAVPDIPRVTRGAAAEVTVSGWGGRVFRGTVARVGLRVTAGALADENPAALKDLRVVPVEITLDEAATAALAPLVGAQVTVKIKGTAGVAAR